VSVKKTGAAKILFLLPLISCGAGSTFSNKNTTPLQLEKKPAGSAASALGTVIPPVVVTGSFLTGVLYNESSNEISGALLKITDSNYQTLTDSKGRFKLPLKFLKSSSFQVEIGRNKIATSNFGVYLPKDIRLLVEKFRDSAADVEMPRILALSVPSGISNQGKPSSQTGIQDLLSVSLPKATGSMDFAAFWDIENLSNGLDARFRWSLPRQPTSVKLAISTKPDSVFGWDASSDDELIRGGGIVVTDFSGCTASDSSPSAGSFVSVPQGVCGLSFSNAPLNIQDRFYFRFAVTEKTVTRLSTVFTVSASAAPPKPPAPQPSKVIFEFTGTTQTWISTRTASAITPIIIKAWGGGGGSVPNSAAGGGSGFVQLKVTSGVNLGDKLTIYVGEAGKTGSASRSGAGGGGATAVLNNNDNSVLIIAAGGGGASAGTSGFGGAGGGQTGEQGGPDNCAGGNGGAGASFGTQGAGGPSNRNYSAGTAGFDGKGGIGGSGNSGNTQTGTGGWGFKFGGDSGSVPGDGGGGGGGGGYAGGGGGGGGCWGMGGGGGSSYFGSNFGTGSTVSGVGASAGNAADEDNAGQGAASKNGRVVIQ
jgi:hypothetical protein